VSGPLVVGAENVILIPDGDNYGAARPLSEGLELVMQLRHHPTTRTTVTINSVDTKMAEHFMRIHGLKDVAVRGIAAEDVREDPAVAEWYVIERIRAAGPVNMVITAHPEVYMRCMDSHQPCLLFGRRGSLGTQGDRPTFAALHARVVAHRDAEAESMDHDQEPG
jgi:hypothetical protein